MLIIERSKLKSSEARLRSQETTSGFMVSQDSGDESRERSVASSMNVLDRGNLQL